MNELNAFEACDLPKEKLAYKGSRFPIAAFLLLTLYIFAGCESSGTVGENLGPGQGEVNKMVIDIDTLETIDSNTFSGRLQHSAMGYFEDPVYGTLHAVALLKPSLSRTQVDSIHDGDTMSLKLQFSSVSYGNDGAASVFDIYEAGQVWRGNELKYNNEVSVDFSSKVGEFEVTDEDSLEVELSDAWVQKFRTFYDAPSAERDSLYRNEFPGLAIVPRESNQKIHFIRHHQEDDDSPDVTRFLVYSEHAEEDEESTDENGENDEEPGDDGPVAQPLDLRDWGSSVVRSNEPASADGIVLHNSERVLRVEFDVPKEELRNRNIVNAKLIFGLRTDVEQVNPAIIRPEVGLLRAHSFNPVPSDLISELFATSARFGAQLDEDVNTFRLDITQYVINEIYGDRSEGPIFISLQSVNGFLYSAHLYNENAQESIRPRIVITSVD